MRVKNFFPHPNELLIRAYPENLVKIYLLVEALDTFGGTGMIQNGIRHIVIIQALLSSDKPQGGFWFGFGLTLKIRLELDC